MLHSILLRRHANHDAVQHIKLVAVVVRFRIFMRQADGFHQLWMHLAVALEGFELMLHGVEASDVSNFESDCFFAVVAHHK